mmetsp:Transcript_7223/g.17962  ORF Transcript_7223/g.17962 Transcript_7223/m.17962 type:complete len:1316 (+) Transcript_7223:84-4031(+)
MAAIIRSSRQAYLSLSLPRTRCYRRPLHNFQYRGLQRNGLKPSALRTSQFSYRGPQTNHDVIKPSPCLVHTEKRYFSKPSFAKAESANETLEETYSRKTPLEHILLRPSMYIGPTERLPPVSSWVLQKDVASDSSASDDTIPSHWTMHREDLPSVPALLKVFDEILVNASDNRLRHPGSCNRIDVTIHRGDSSSEPYISVANNGKSIPVQIHKKEKMYIPELLFGHLLTGSNFNDDQKRLTGGRHGYGAKLTNVFSKEFVVEIRDAHSTKGKCKTYRQVWKDNMHACYDAEVTVETKQNGKDLDYTKISFVPDLARLTSDPNVKIIPEEEYKLMRRRVIDIAGCSGGKLTVTLNGDEIPVSGFEDYVNLYRESIEPPAIYHKLNARWEVAVGLSETKSLESISFVNGMNTSRGGTHVDVLARQISQYIAEHINTKMAKQEPPIKVSARMVRRHLSICVNSLIENPSFDSQMKECLTSNPENFGSHYELPNRFLRKLVKPAATSVGSDSESDEDSADVDTETDELGGPGIVEEVLRMALGAQQVNVAKLLKEVGASSKQTKRQVLSIPKLEDANFAGGKHSGDCSLILTEGDSAKALAVAGLEVVGRDKHGVFPLRGKFLNVRNVSLNQLAKNVELKAMCAILGLQFEKTYATRDERKELRYGHVMLMTDQDADGSHIKGLILNLFRHFWPALLKPPRGKKKSEQNEDRPFLSMFVTPLLKATKRGRKKESLSFFSLAEYNIWRESLEDDEIHKWSVKYYKGLGTSTPAEAKEYFLAFIKHHRPFRWHSEKKDGSRIDMAFEKDRADDRKDWILKVYDEKSTVSIDESDGNSVTYGDFVDNELIHFSNANNIRSLPNVIDGLKPSQRKVLHACFKRNLKDEIKVAQLAGYCAEHTAYHHGEASLHATIVGMAQDFVGSNNINLLTPSGQFGTRLMGGSDAASPRYIFTHLSPFARLLFPDVDDMLLNFKEEDGQTIEPQFFCPVIPLLLVNGCQGIGTGWSTFIPQHNPRDVLNYIRAKLDGKKRLPDIRPWVKDFGGSISVDAARGSYVTEGIITPTSKSSVAITELPIGVWTNDYKNTLVNMLNRGDIKSFSENHTTTSVSFDVKLNISKLQRFLNGDIHKTFKLRNTLSTRNMNAFTTDMTISRYTSPEDIANAFFPIRLDLYADRKSVLESNMEYSAKLMRNKSRFIEAVAAGEIDLLRGRKSKEATNSLLEEMGFLTHSDLDAIKMNNSIAKRRLATEAISDGSTLDEESQKDLTKEYAYMLNMPLSSLTLEKIEALNKEASKTDSKLDEIRNTSASDLWREDLNKIELYL